MASNYIKINADEAINAVKKAGSREIGAQSELAWALMGVYQQAYAGNLTPALTLAERWSDAQRKRATKILAYLTSKPKEREAFRTKEADLRVAKPSENSKGARLVKGWDTRKMEWVSFEDFETMILSTCPNNKSGEPIRTKASIRELEKMVKKPAEQAMPTLESVRDKAIKDVNGLSIMGVPEDYVEKVLTEAFAKVEAYGKQALKQAEADAARASAKAKERSVSNSGRSTGTKRQKKAA